MIPILTYHAIGDVQSPLYTPVGMFTAQISALAAAGYRSISLGEALTRLSGGGEVAKRAIVLTFDDGYASVYDLAWPILRKHGFDATVFLVTGYVGKDNQWPSQPRGVPAAPLMTWSNVNDLLEYGFAFEAHTCSHPPLSQLREGQIKDELALSKAELEKHTGIQSNTFAYPYGDSNESVRELVRQQFDGAVTTQLGIAGSLDDPFDLPRIDAFYLSPRLIPLLDTGRFRAYLGLRQKLRSLRRVFTADWESKTRFV